MIDPPGDGDCFFHIVTFIAKLMGWNDIPFDPNDLRRAVSNELKHPSKNADHVFFLPMPEKIMEKEASGLDYPLSTTKYEFIRNIAKSSLNGGE